MNNWKRIAQVLAVFVLILSVALIWMLSRPRSVRIYADAQTCSDGASVEENFFSACANFCPSDADPKNPKKIFLMYPDGHTQTATIMSFINRHQITISVLPSPAIENGLFVWGHVDDDALEKAITR